MTPRNLLFHFTLIDFQGKVIEERDAHFKYHASAVARAYDLLWDFRECARVIVESSPYFHVTLEWGVRRGY